MPDGKYLLIKAVSVTLMNDDTDCLGVQCMNKTGWKNKCKSRTPENFHAVSRHSSLKHRNTNNMKTTQNCGQVNHVFEIIA